MTPEQITAESWSRYCAALRRAERQEAEAAPIIAGHDDAALTELIEDALRDAQECDTTLRDFARAAVGALRSAYVERACT